HQRDVVLEAVVVVAGGLAAVALEHGALLPAERVPDGGAAAVLVGGALDLVGRGRDAPEEVLREGRAFVGFSAGLRVAGFARGARAGRHRHARRRDAKELSPADSVVAHSRLVYHRSGAAKQ